MGILMRYLEVQTPGSVPALMKVLRCAADRAVNANGMQTCHHSLRLEKPQDIQMSWTPGGSPLGHQTKWKEDHPPKPLPPQDHTHHHGRGYRRTNPKQAGGPQIPYLPLTQRGHHPQPRPRAHRIPRYCTEPPGVAE